jgi:FkbM family methyltransferase
MDTIRKAITRSAALRTVVKSGPVQHAIITGRATACVRPRARFATAQLSRRTRRYQLPSGRDVLVRHRTRDLAILVEVFGAHRIYEPPEPVRALLESPLRVIDLGANIGLFSLWALDRWGVHDLVTFEPDPDNARLLDALAADCQWDRRTAAASNHNGTMRFRAGLYSESRAAHDGEPAITVPVADLFAESPCDLLKIDIEGGEWPILADPRLEGFARVIVMEWHGAECPELDASATVHRLLQERGYTSCHDVPGDWERNGLLWAWR